MQEFFWDALRWIFRIAVIRFMFVGTGYVGMTEMLPWVIDEFVLPFLDVESLGLMMLTYISPGMWWILDAFNVRTGFSLLMSAWVARFVLRRVPLLS